MSLKSQVGTQWLVFVIEEDLTKAMNNLFRF